MPYALEMSLRLAWVVNAYSLVLVRICSELNQRKRLQLVTARKSSAVVCGQCTAVLVSPPPGLAVNISPTRDHSSSDYKTVGLWALDRF